MNQRPRRTYTPLLTPLITLAIGIAVQNAIMLPCWVLITGCSISSLLLIGAIKYRRMPMVRAVCALLAGCVGALLLTLQLS